MSVRAAKRSGMWLGANHLITRGVRVYLGGNLFLWEVVKVRKKFIRVAEVRIFFRATCDEILFYIFYIRLYD